MIKQKDDAPEKKEFNAKIILIGDSSVGKTCLTGRFLFDKYTEFHKITIGVDYGDRRITMSNGEECLVRIWDSAGQETYKNIVAIYYRKKDAVLICFDLNNRKSFDSVDTWMSICRERVDPKTLIYLVGNKSDLVQVVSEDEIKAKSEELGFADYFLLSAKTDGERVYSMFQKLAEDIYRTKERVKKPEKPQVNLGIINIEESESEDDKCC